MELGIPDILMIFLVTIGPLKATIVYASLTATADAAFKREVAVKTVLTATIVCLLFVLAGEFLMAAFKVSLPALKIAGGVILLLYALGMVMGEGPSGEGGTAQSTDIGITPLAMPLMATPQGIILITTITATTTTIGEVLIIIGLILGLMTFNFFFLLGADRIIRLLGVNALQIIERIVGLMLAALAVQLMMWGLVDLDLLKPTI